MVAHVIDRDLLFLFSVSVGMTLNLLVGWCCQYRPKGLACCMLYDNHEAEMISQLIV